MIANGCDARVARAFAPACIGNTAVGFDILGHTMSGAADRGQWPMPPANADKLRNDHDLDVHTSIS